MKPSQQAANRALYNTPDALAHYAAYNVLQPPEMAILKLLGPRLRDMDMLDIGVGAGRTALHFPPLAKSYLGIDMAAAMVAACRARFPDLAFALGDAADLAAVADASADFVLFSFNGIDCLDLDGRRRALLELRRVLRPGGVLAFSGHNMNFVPGSALAGSAGARDPLALFDSFKRYLRFRRHVRAVRYDPGFETATVVESHFGRSVELAYVRPAWQVRQLAELGFAAIRVLPGDSEAVFDADAAEVGTIADPWAYYLCEMPR